MVTTSFIKGEILSLQTKIAAARLYGESGISYSLYSKNIENIKDMEDLLECLEYALQHKNDIDEGYKVFAILTRTLYEDFLKIANADIADGEKIIKIEEIIQNLNFYEAAKKAASTQKKPPLGEIFDLPRGVVWPITYVIQKSKA